MRRDILAFLVSAIIVALVAVALFQPTRTQPTAGPPLTYNYFLPNVESNPPTPTPIPPTALPPTNTSVPPPPAQILVLDNQYTFTSSSYLYILGEVVNNTGVTASYVKVVVNLFNNGVFVATDFSYIYIDNLPHGGRTCFEVLFYHPPAFTTYKIEQPSYSSYSFAQPAPPLDISNVSGAVGSNEYDIIGMIRNNNAFRVEYVKAVGTLYNAQGRVVGCDFSYVGSTHLDPGQQSAFDIWMYSRNYSDVTSYRVQADGRKP